MTDYILDVKDVSKDFIIETGGFISRPVVLHALKDISFSVKAGESIGIVGESGCGKSTLGRIILRLIEASNGEIWWEDQDICTLNDHQMHDLRRDIQIIFQDPLSSLNPRMTVGDIISEPLRNLYPHMSLKERRHRVLGAMSAVGLLPGLINRFPHEFSGGQAQRIGIARALVCEPKMIVCDEPVSALDVSIQAQILNLLGDLRERFNITLLFISHDLNVIYYLVSKVLVLYMGKVMEFGAVDQIFDHPRHPYTQALLSSMPGAVLGDGQKRELELLEGDLPSPIHPPSGCVFRTRCQYAKEHCARVVPLLVNVDDGKAKSDVSSQVACHFHLDI